MTGSKNKNKNVSSDISEMTEFVNKMTPEEAQAFIKRIMGPPKRILDGREYENVWLMILLQDEPDEVSNNQHSITEVYKINQREYHIHYFSGEDPIIEEILNDDM